MKVYCNGRLLDEAEAYLGIGDRGLLYGDGLFETLRVRKGRVEFLAEHLTRLYGSASEMAIPIPLDRNALAGALLKVVEANGADDLALRLTLTRGRGSRRLDLDGCGPASVVITASPWAGVAAGTGMDGITLATCPFPRNERSPLCRHKTLNYLESVLARDMARRLGAEDALFLNITGRIAEAAAANIFLVLDGVLVTPSIQEGALPGIVRGAVLRAARSIGLEAQERGVEQDELWRASEVFLTNSLIGLLPVAALDGRPVSPSKSPRWLLRLQTSVAEMADPAGG